MYRFTLPRDLYHGKDALSSLKNLSGKKAVVVVGGGSMKRFGFLDKVVSYLKEAGMEVELFEGIEPDPSVFCFRSKTRHSAHLFGNRYCMRIDFMN